jgi:phosphoribosylamine-glycine ligase
MATSPKQVIVVTRDWSGLGLGILMQRQGSKVLFAWDFKEGDDKDAEAQELCGDGLVEKIPLAEATLNFLAQSVLWVFDSNEHAEVAQRLIQMGEQVIGTSQLSAHMENDRLFAGRIAKEIGFDLPETKEFSDYSVAIQFLESRKSQAFVYKPNEGDPTATFVPQELDDPVKANEVLREYIGSLKPEGEVSFILQALIPKGIEANFEIWARDGKPIAAFINLEAKRKLTGDLGTLIGCAGGYVTKVPLESKGIQQTVARYLGRKELAHYTGSIDANVIFAEGKVYFLENCFRFGYNAYPEIFYALAKDNMELILREWVTGRDHRAIEQHFLGGFAGSLTLTTDKCQLGCPILLSGAARTQTCIYQAFQEEGHLMEVGGWPEIACVVMHGDSIEEAGVRCLDTAKQVAFPNKGHRIDLAHDDLPSLPLARYKALVTAKLLK